MLLAASGKLREAYEAWNNALKALDFDNNTASAKSDYEAGKEAWIKAYGDPNDPAVRAKINAAIQQLHQNRVGAPSTIKHNKRKQKSKRKR